MLIRTGIRLLGVVVGVILILRCQSKYSEVSPERRSINGAPLTERMDTKKEVDQRLEQVQLAAQRIEMALDTAAKLLATIEETRGLKKPGNPYTPIDFLIDMNKSFSEKIPEQVPGNQVRHARVRLPDPTGESAKEASRYVDSTLETLRATGTGNGARTRGSAIEKMIYKVRPWTSSDPVTVFEVNWNGGEFAWQIDYRNLAGVWNEIVKGLELGDQGSCMLDLDENGNLLSFSCKNIEVIRAENGSAIVRDFTFGKEGKLDNFRVKFDVYRDNQLTATEDCVFQNNELQCSR